MILLPLLLARERSCCSPSRPLSRRASEEASPFGGPAGLEVEGERERWEENEEAAQDEERRIPSGKSTRVKSKERRSISRPKKCGGGGGGGYNQREALGSASTQSSESLFPRGAPCLSSSLLRRRGGHLLRRQISARANTQTSPQKEEDLAWLGTTDRSIDRKKEGCAILLLFLSSVSLVRKSSQVHQHDLSWLNPCVGRSVPPPPSLPPC